MALKVLCSGSLKGRLRGGSPRWFSRISHGALSPTGIAVCRSSKSRSQDKGIRFAPSGFDATTMHATFFLEGQTALAHPDSGERKL